MAAREDALIVAALVLQADLDAGAARRPGFLDTYAEAWLADVEHRPTWLACVEDGTVVGVVQATLVRKLPSLRRATTGVVHVSQVFVHPDHRGRGIAEGLLRAMLAWGGEQGVERYTLNAVPEARTLYARVGFGPPAERFMERRETQQRGTPDRTR